MCKLKLPSTAFSWFCIYHWSIWKMERGPGCRTVREHLPSLWDTLGSLPTIRKKTNPYHILSFFSFLMLGIKHLLYHLATWQPPHIKLLRACTLGATPAMLIQSLSLVVLSATRCQGGSSYNFLGFRGPEGSKINSSPVRYDKICPLCNDKNDLVARRNIRS